MASVLTIDELAARCDHYGERASRLFELTGHWSAIAEPDIARVVLARLSTYCSMHVEWWQQRRPSVDLDEKAWPELDAAAERAAVALAALADGGPTPRGMQNLRTEMDRLSAELGEWAREHDPDVDAPTVRILDLVVADLSAASARLSEVLGVAAQP